MLRFYNDPNSALHKEILASNKNCLLCIRYTNFYYVKVFHVLHDKVVQPMRKYYEHGAIYCAQKLIEKTSKKLHHLQNPH